MSTLTIRVIVDGVTRLVETGIPLSRWNTVVPTIGPIIDDLRAIGPVVILGEGDDGVTHILGIVAMSHDVIALVFIVITLPFVVGIVIAIVYGLVAYFWGW